MRFCVAIASCGRGRLGAAGPGYDYRLPAAVWERCFPAKMHGGRDVFEKDAAKWTSDKAMRTITVPLRDFVADSSDTVLSDGTRPPAVLIVNQDWP